MVRVHVPEALLLRMRARAARHHPHECCGLLVGVADGPGIVVRRALACANKVRGPDRARRFLVDPRTLLHVLRALRRGDESLVGFYHSHPDAEPTPSATDLTFLALWPETVWLILSVDGAGRGTERAWWLPLDAREPTERRELEVLR